MSDAADRRIAELEAEVKPLREQYSRELGIAHSQRDRFNQIANDWMNKCKELEAKLVERDVYEAQQILPPEQAALIKHLATVERCIEEGPYDAGGYEERMCVFCRAYDQEHHHLKYCAWLALQFDRKPAETMALVEGWAWEENARRDRDRARAMAPRRPMTATEASLRQSLYRPGTAYVFQPGAGLESEIALRLKMDEINGTGLYPKPDLGIPDTAVAPPDDEDVP